MRLAYLLFFSTLDTELLLAKSKQNQRQVYIERSFRRVLDPEIHLLTLEEKKKVNEPKPIVIWLLKSASKWNMAR